MGCGGDRYVESELTIGIQDREPEAEAHHNTNSMYSEAEAGRVDPPDTDLTSKILKNCHFSDVLPCLFWKEDAIVH